MMKTGRDDGVGQLLACLGQVQSICDPIPTQRQRLLRLPQAQAGLTRGEIGCVSGVIEGGAAPGALPLGREFQEATPRTLTTRDQIIGQIWHAANVDWLNVPPPVPEPPPGDWAMELSSTVSAFASRRGEGSF